MQVLILDEDPVLCRALAAVLRGQGLDVLAFTAIAPATEAARRAILDLLVLRERVGGRLTHDLALLAEWRNPGLGVVLLSDRDAEAREELSDLIPAIRAILPPDAPAAEVARVTLAVARAQAAGTVPSLPHAIARRGSDAEKRLPARPPQLQPRRTVQFPSFTGATPRAETPRPAPVAAGSPSGQARTSPPRRLHLA